MDYMVMIGIAAVIVPVVLTLVRIPIAFAFGIVGIVGTISFSGFDHALWMAGQIPFSWGTSIALLCLPLFLLLGFFITAAGIGEEIYQFGYRLMGRLGGGLAMGTVVAGTLLGAACGSAIGAAGALSALGIPQMRKYGYKDDLIGGSIAASATLSIMIPPSGALIIYGMLAEESIGKLFIAAILPGIMICMLFLLTIYLIIKINPEKGPSGPSFSWKERLFAFRYGWKGALIFIIILGGIYGGVFTPTEAASVSVVTSLLFLIFKRDLLKGDKMKRFTLALKQTAISTGAMYTVIFLAMMYRMFLVVTGLPNWLLATLSGLDVNKYIILCLILLLIITLGCLIETISLAFIVLPLFLPLLAELGFNLIWFGILFIAAAQIGWLTPPVGLCCYVVKGVSEDMEIMDIFKGAFPFVCILMLSLIILMIIPQIALVLLL